MFTKSSLPKFWIVLIFILAIGILRVILSGIPNIAPVAALALFGGYYIKNKKLAFLIPLIVMFLSDIALEVLHQTGLREYSGFHAMMPFIYFGFLLVVLIGSQMKEVKPIGLFGTGLLSSIAFFVVSNFGVWVAGGLYPLDFSGFMACYVSAIPFFRYTLLGDLFFIFTFFGLFELVRYKFPSLVLAPVKS